VIKTASQWPIQINKVGRGSDSGMKKVLMKQELEVIAIIKSGGEWVTGCFKPDTWLCPGRENGTLSLI